MKGESWWSLSSHWSSLAVHTAEDQDDTEYYEAHVSTASNRSGSLAHRWLGFPFYMEDTVETPIALLVVSVAYVVVSLVFVLTLLTHNKKTNKTTGNPLTNTNNTTSTTNHPAQSTNIEQEEPGTREEASTTLLKPQGMDMPAISSPTNNKSFSRNSSSAVGLQEQQPLQDHEICSSPPTLHHLHPTPSSSHPNATTTTTPTTSTRTTMSQKKSSSSLCSSSRSDTTGGTGGDGRTWTTATTQGAVVMEPPAPGTQDDDDDDERKPTTKDETEGFPPVLQPRNPPSQTIVQPDGSNNTSTRLNAPTKLHSGGEVELPSLSRADATSSATSAALHPPSEPITSTTTEDDGIATTSFSSVDMKPRSLPNGAIRSSFHHPQQVNNNKNMALNKTHGSMKALPASNRQNLTSTEQFQQEQHWPQPHQPQHYTQGEYSQDAGLHPDLTAAEASNPQYLQRPLRSWDLMSSATMRFRHGHFSGRSVQRLVQQERHHVQELLHESSQNGDGNSRHSSNHSRRTGLSGVSSLSQHRRGGGGASLSEVASHVLEQETVQGEAEFYRQRYVQKSAAQQQRQQQQALQQQQGTATTKAMPSRNPTKLVTSGTSMPNFRRLSMMRGTAKGPSSVISRTSSGRSRMPTLSPDVVSPDDAADAFDPGISLPSPTYDGAPYDVDDFNSDSNDDNYKDEIEPPPSCCSNLLELAEPDDEVRRILFLAAPSTLGAIAEPCFRLGMVAIISHFIDTDSMVAFVLVILFVRITTEELSGAITDAESSLLHQALSMGGDAGFFMAGRHVQMAILVQLALAIPVLVAWAFVMEDVVTWLVPGNDQVGQLAAEYTRIIVVDYALQAASRTFMLVFHMTGQAQFELNVDLIAAAVTIAAIALTASMAENPSLNWIAWLQVVVGIIKIATKVGIVVFKGLVQPYRKGLLGTLALSDRQAAWAFVGTTMPLLLGSLIELREWEILLLFIRHLGGAEVAAWALMGIVWEIFEASTEGLGEAAAVRVSLVLSENVPDLARQLAHKSVLLGMVLSLLVTSVFLLLGLNLSVALTEDSTLQNLFNDLVGVTGLANITMSMAQVYWSLLGSQGRFGVASSSILLCRWLLTMPLAAGFIFGAEYDLRAVGSALAIGYMTSTILLTWRLFQSDWNMYAQMAKEDAMLGEDDDEDDEEEALLADGYMHRGNHAKGESNDANDEEDEEDEEDYDDDEEESSSSSDSSTGFG